MLLPKKVQPQQLTAAQVKALTTPLNSLVRVHNQWAASCVPLSGGRTITRQLRNCMLPGLTQMNTLVNQERTVVRSLEPSFALGPCRLALTGFDQQLYGFHLGLAQAAGGVSVADPNLLTLGLGTINSASTAVAASTKLTLPAACN